MEFEIYERWVIIPNVKIAVVDDDRSIRELVANVLMYCVNREVFSFDNALEAWDFVRASDNIDIIVTDVEMPEMTGLDLLKMIKQRFPQKICIVMSGDVTNEKEAEALGADVFLAKPFKINDLFDIVQNYVVEDGLS